MVHKLVPYLGGMAGLPADLRGRRELIETLVSVLQARMQREDLT